MLVHYLISDLNYAEINNNLLLYYYFNMVT